MASVLLTAQYCQQEEGRQQLPAAFTLPEHAPGVFIPLVRLTRWPCLGTCFLLCSVQVLPCAVCRYFYLLEKRGLGETQRAVQCQRTWDAHNSPTIIPFFVNLCNALFQMYTAKPRVSRGGKDTAFFSLASYQYSSPLASDTRTYLLPLRCSNPSSCLSPALVTFIPFSCCCCPLLPSHLHHLSGETGNWNNGKKPNTELKSIFAVLFFKAWPTKWSGQ